MKKIIISACGCACLLLPLSTMAGDFDMDHGKWEFTTTLTMPMFPQPQVTTTTECITEEEAKQDPMTNLINDGSCTILNKKKSGSTLDFAMECNEGGITSRGKGQFTARGKTASGFMEMTMDMPAMPNMPDMPTGPMKMTTSWTGKRIGACE